jgi:hypothetical protein
MMTSAPRWLVRTWPLVLIAGVALAAPDDSNGKGADIKTSKDVKLTPEETMTQAKDYNTKMQQMLRDVSKLRDDAQKQKDVIKLNCITDKLTQIKGHMAVVDKSMVSLSDAIAKRDDGTRLHEFTRVTILAQKVNTLNSEARNCVGEDITYFGDQRVIVEVDPSITPDDPTYNKPPAVEPPPRPTEASPEGT